MFDPVKLDACVSVWNISSHNWLNWRNDFQHTADTSYATNRACQKESSMSGITGIFHRTGVPVEGQQLQAMTSFMAYRGPDGMDTFAADGIGLGQTMLRTTEVFPPDRQPASLGALWITADVRLDCRTELAEKLTKTNNGYVVSGVSDAMLILHAYAVWGRDCVDHLRGDFSFGIWDTAAKVLFCARDHLGIKPFYYADLGKVFLFSNTLNCLRQHPQVTAELNEAAIGDFLLFGLNYNKSTTTFRDIQRLPPGHLLVVSKDKLEIKSYWQPPTEGRIRYARADEYLERFAELLRSAVEDRLRTDSIGMFLSGGLDSGAIAVTAKEIAISHGGLPILNSYTMGYDSLIPDDERVYARKVARHLDIPNRYIPLDQVQLFENWEHARYRFPEPNADPLSSGGFDGFDTIAADCRVALFGEGPDNLMYFQMWPYIKELRRTRQWGRLITETAWFLWVRPLPWRGAAQRIQSAFAKATRNTGIPHWIAPEFAKRARLEERWVECNKLSFPDKPHLVRPKGHASMLLPQWTNMFEVNDPGVTHALVEVRYPFVDLRLVEYLLAIPMFPWAYKKRLSRKLLAGKLPHEVLLRPKTPLSGDPAVAKFRLSAIEWTKRSKLDGRVREFVAPSSLDNVRVAIRSEEFRPFCLNLWLKGMDEYDRP
jgi:asparagine synthase (glutamine-hydrolysing)